MEFYTKAKRISATIRIAKDRSALPRGGNKGQKEVEFMVAELTKARIDFSVSFYDTTSDIYDTALVKMTYATDAQEETIERVLQEASIRAGRMRCA